jgi:hypothetical protein
MIMNVPTGSTASSLIDARPAMPADEAAAASRPRSAYLRDLALRRQADAIRRQTVYGLVMGWILLLVAGFIYCCVPNPVDLLWAALMVIGALHMAAAIVLPQALAWPEWLWIAVARWQGWLIMTILLTIVYFALIWPAAIVSRRRIRGFVTWDGEPPPSSTAWQPIDLAETEIASVAGQRSRSLPLLVAGVIAFFFRRGNYLLLAIVILLVVLGLALYFVQSSAFAPFIYPLL